MVELRFANKEQIPDFSNITRLEELRGLISNPLASNDVGARMNYCSSKRITYWGRGGKLICDGETEIPMLMGVWSSASMSEKAFKEFIEEFVGYYGTLIEVEDFVGDGEFVSDANKKHLEQAMNCTVRFTTANINKDEEKRLSSGKFLEQL